MRSLEDTSAPTVPNGAGLALCSWVLGFPFGIGVSSEPKQKCTIRKKKVHEQPIILLPAGLVLFKRSKNDVFSALGNNYAAQRTSGEEMNGLLLADAPGFSLAVSGISKVRRI